MITNAQPAEIGTQQVFPMAVGLHPTIHHLFEMRRRFDKKAARELAKLCAEWDIDLVHCHYLREHYTALLAKKYNKKIRVVYTNHFVLANDFVTRFSNRIMDRRQDQMIAVCNKGKEQLIANGWSADPNQPGK